MSVQSIFNFTPGPFTIKYLTDFTANIKQICKISNVWLCVMSVAVAVDVRNMLPNSLLKLNTLQLIKFRLADTQGTLTIVGTAVDLDPHADRSLMRTVGMESDLAGQDDGLQVLLDRDVGVGVPLEDLAVLDVPVPRPLVEAGPEVLKHVVLRELRALAIPEPPHGLGGGDGVDGAQVDLDPLGAVLADHVPRAPRPAVLIQANPGNGKGFYLEPDKR